MNAKISRQLQSRKRRIQNRLDKNKFGDEWAVISAGNIHYEIADRNQAITAGGIGLIHQLVKVLELDTMLNRHLQIFKIYMPYTESDHVLNIAYNLLAGGSRLEHLEQLRNNEAYLNALGAHRIPDPTTAGDFCRRFHPLAVQQLMEILNSARLKVCGNNRMHFLMKPSLRPMVRWWRRPPSVRRELTSITKANGATIP